MLNEADAEYEGAVAALLPGTFELMVTNCEPRHRDEMMHTDCVILRMTSIAFPPIAHKLSILAMVAMFRSDFLDAQLSDSHKLKLACHLLQMHAPPLPPATPPPKRASDAMRREEKMTVDRGKRRALG
jgi:hypothetical protein